MPRKNKPVPGHTTLIISSPDEGQLDDASQSQLLEMMKLEDSDAQGALLSDLASWGHNAYRLYKQDEVTLPKKVVKSTLQEVNQAAEHLGQLLTQLDTQSEGELVVAYAALKDSLSTQQEESLYAVERLAQVREALGDLCKITHFAVEHSKVKRGRKPQSARYLAVQELVAIIQKYSGKALKRQTNRETGRPEGLLVEAVHLCLKRFEDQLSIDAIDDTIRRVLEHGGN